MTGRTRGLFPLVRNHRGVEVSTWLGPAVFGLLLVVAAVVAATNPSDAVVVAAEAWALPVVFLAGLFDDFRPSRTRGLVRQIGLLLRGRVTSGIVKLVVIVGASAAAAGIMHQHGLRLALAIPVLAGSANLWNLLDVAPGRSLKAFVLAEAALLPATWGGAYGGLALGSILVSVPALLVDLREWSMLGDSGANVIGFVVGIGLVRALSTTGLAIVLGAILLLHALAETVTLSRLYRGTPPLRWLDDLGRRSSTDSTSSAS